MKQIFLICLMVLFFSNNCYAQITKTINDFDNSTIIYSISKKQPQRLPQFYLFKKYVTQNAIDYYLTIHNKNSVTNIFSATENVKAKINHTDIYTIETVISPDIRLERQATLRFSESFANKILNAQHIEFQMPIYKERINEETTYFYIIVPSEILAEWKQVIQMN